MNVSRLELNRIKKSDNHVQIRNLPNSKFQFRLSSKKYSKIHFECWKTEEKCEKKREMCRICSFSSSSTRPKPYQIHDGTSRELEENVTENEEDEKFRPTWLGRLKTRAMMSVKICFKLIFFSGRDLRMSYDYEFHFRRVLCVWWWDVKIYSQ